MKPRPPITAPPVSMNLIALLAEGYADLGLAEYNKLAATIDHPDRVGFTLQASMRIGIPAAMILAFAVELYLKILIFQRTGQYAQSHELDYLISLLPEDVVDRMKVGYEERVSTQKLIYALDFSVVLGSSVPEESLPLGAPRPGDSFEEAIKLAAPLFVRLRYIYERVDAGFSEYVDFRWLIFLVDVARIEAADYKGNMGLIWGDPLQG